MLRVRAATRPVMSDRRAILARDMPDEDFALLMATRIPADLARYDHEVQPEAW